MSAPPSTAFGAGAEDSSRPGITRIWAPRCAPWVAVLARPITSIVEIRRPAPPSVEPTTISWPNYHSGSNGDFQRITAIEPAHPLLLDPDNRKRTIEFFPSHPH